MLKVISGLIELYVCVCFLSSLVIFLLFLAGCGASYEIVVVTDEFAKMRMVNQHRLVSEALKQQLPNIHAIRIFTGTDEKEFIG